MCYTPWVSSAEVHLGAAVSAHHNRHSFLNRLALPCIRCGDEREGDLIGAWPVGNDARDALIGDGFRFPDSRVGLETP